MFLISAKYWSKFRETEFALLGKIEALPKWKRSRGFHFCFLKHPWAIVLSPNPSFICLVRGRSADLQA
jgi:hypothetical protein